MEPVGITLTLLAGRYEVGSRSDLGPAGKVRAATPRQRVVEERAHGLPGRLAEALAHAGSVGVAAGPRSTMSNR